VFGIPESVAADGAAGFHHYTAHGGFMPKGWWGTWVAVIISIFSYLGVEMIAVASGEALEPERAIRNAFRSTILRLVVFYLCTLALMLAIVPWTGAGEHESPFVTVMKATGISGAAGVVNFVVLVAALSAMNSQLYIATRMMFSLSRAGYAPKAFGEVGRRGVPLRALMLSTLGMAVATLVNVWVPDASFTVMMAIAIFGALFTWMMIFVTHWCFRRHWQTHGRQPLRFRMWGFPALTLLGATLMLAILVTTAFTEPFRLTLITGVPFLALLTVVYFVWYRGKPAAKLNLEY
jgi:L-asparagine transporter-like permease